MTKPASSSTFSYPTAPVLFADGLILFVALLIKFTGSSPLGTVEKTGIAACAIFAGVITALPFILAYKRRQETPSFVAAPAVVPQPSATPAEVTPAWTEAFANLQARLDRLEQTLTAPLKADITGLRTALDEQRAGEIQARDALREEIRQAIAISQQTTTAHLDALLAAARTSAADQQEIARRSLEDMAASTRQEFTAITDRLLVRLDEQWNTALSTWETRTAETIRKQIAEELAEEKAAALRRAVPAPTLTLEATPAVPPSGKSRLGRGLESLITSPQAKPSVTESPEPQLPFSTSETISSIPLGVSPPPQEITPLIPDAPEAATPVSTVSASTEKPASHPEASRTKREPVIAVLDPFHIPANGYADLAQAMDASYEEAHSRESR